MQTEPVEVSRAVVGNVPDAAHVPEVPTVPDVPAAAGSPAARGLTLAEVPRLELDELLTQLIGRAQDVLAAQGRLRGLFAATQMIISDLELPVMLRHIVDAACSLVHASYGALGVLDGVGGLAEFVHVGLTEEQARGIGELPHGRGLVGALVADPRPIRLRRIADHPRSVGFPAGHPPMEGFLGVPIRVRGEVFGNLYLCNPAAGEFTAEDEELVVALAATAGVSIENARLYSEASRRQDWLQASGQITRHLLSVEGEDPLPIIAREAAQLADADAVSVVLPTADGEQLMVEVAVGPGAETLVGFTYPIANTYAGEAFATGRPVLVADATNGDRITHLARTLQVGPMMVLPLIGSTRRARGALILGRANGRRRFDHAELGMATMFASHATLALELADARDDRQRMILLEDRDRIARDLHDHVIQRLFATGLSIQSVAAAQTDEPRRERLERAVTDIDETIRQIRTSIFQLRGPLGMHETTLRTKVLQIVTDVTPMLGFGPRVDLDGPIDTAIDDRVGDDVLAVIREGLTNAAKHAHATAVALRLHVDAQRVRIDIADDGAGIGPAQRRSGLANLRLRAEQHGGDFEITDTGLPRSGAEGKGTRLRWTIPLT